MHRPGGRHVTVWSTVSGRTEALRLALPVWYEREGTPLCLDYRQVPSMDYRPATQQSAEPSVSAAALIERTAGSHRLRETARPRVPRSWPLLAILAVQTLLSLRLIRADTAFQDEAEYLWAGHLEWAHLLHGTPLPQFPAYFSGAPVLYPPVGALADSVGGLAGARILSLAFMLGATAALWATAGRLFGRRAAFFAAALVRSLRPDAALGRVRHLRRHGTVLHRPCGLARRPGRGPAGRDRLDGGGRASRWRWPTPSRIRQPCSTRW